MARGAGCRQGSAVVFGSSHQQHCPTSLTAAEGKSSEGKLKEEDVEVLNQRLAEARDGSGAARSVGGAAAAAEAEQGEERPSFLRSTDDEVSAALAGRIAQVAANKGAAGSLSSSAVGSGEGQEGGDAAAPEGAALTGQLLADLMLAKWGKLYDLSFVRRDIPLGKTLICLNVRTSSAAGWAWRG